MRHDGHARGASEAAAEISAAQPSLFAQTVREISGLLDRVICVIVVAGFCAIATAFVIRESVSIDDAESVAGVVIAPVQAEAPEDPTTLLSASDAELYQRIFAVQADGDWHQADSLIARLSSPALMGHVLHQRYMHPTAYRSSFEELSGWLADYADHPDAARVYSLALRRQPSGAQAPAAPVKRRSVHGSRYHQAGVAPGIPRLRSSDARQTLRSLIQLIEVGEAKRAVARTNTLRRDKDFSALNVDIIRVRLSQAMLYQGYVAQARDLAALAAMRSREDIATADWIAGLAAWRLGDFDDAAAHFTALAERRDVGAWTRAGAAFWAARSLRAQADDVSAEHWLLQAARFPHTFYGLIAQRALGDMPRLDFSIPVYDTDVRAKLLAEPAGRRALALIEAGQLTRAEDELLRLHPSDYPDLVSPILAVAEEYGLARLAYRFGHLVPGPRGGRWHAALYPVAKWQEVGDDFGTRPIRIDRALTLAIMRQESRFETRANSAAGAKGLMQLMPITVRHVAGTDRARNKDVYDPAVNVALAEFYLGELLTRRGIDGNLFETLVAYNAGPTRLTTWRRQLGSAAQDPLTFIESLPIAETRAYVEHVLANFWIYRMRLGQPVPSLDQLASDQWPRYESFDEERLMVAEYDAD